MRPTDDDYGTDHAALHGLKHHEPLYTDELHNEDVAHEHTDVNIRTLIIFAVGLAVVTGFVMLLMGGLFKVFQNMAATNDPTLPPHAIPAGQLPPQPRLLYRDQTGGGDEPAALAKQRQTEAEALGQYRWIDQAGGVAQLPIDQAKKLLLERGLPVRADALTDAWIGTRSAGPARGESSSGRAIPLKRGAATEEAPQEPAPQPTEPAAAQPPHKGGH